MLMIFTETQATQPRCRSDGTAPTRALTRRAKLPLTTSRCAGQIPREGQWQASSRRLIGLLSGTGAVLREWRRRKNSRFELSRLDERMLHDIGLTRFHAEYEMNKPFWRE